MKTCPTPWKSLGSSVAESLAYNWEGDAETSKGKSSPVAVSSQPEQVPQTALDALLNLSGNCTTGERSRSNDSIGGGAGSEPSGSGSREANGSKASSEKRGDKPDSGGSCIGASYAPGAKQVTLEQLRKVFFLPGKDAAKKLGVSSNLLKRICRRHNIQRWPQRKLLGLTNLQTAIENDKNISNSDQKVMLKRMQDAIDAVMKDPNHVVEQDLQELRQVNYKQVYNGKHNERGKLSMRSLAAAVAKNIVNEEDGLHGKEKDETAQAEGHPQDNSQRSNDEVMHHPNSGQPGWAVDVSQLQWLKDRERSSIQQQQLGSMMQSNGSSGQSFSLSASYPPNLLGLPYSSTLGVLPSGLEMQPSNLNLLHWGALHGSLCPPMLGVNPYLPQGSAFGGMATIDSTGLGMGMGMDNNLGLARNSMLASASHPSYLNPLDKVACPISAGQVIQDQSGMHFKCIPCGPPPSGFAPAAPSGMAGFGAQDMACTSLPIPNGLGLVSASNGSSPSIFNGGACVRGLLVQHLAASCNKNATMPMSFGMHK